MHCAACRFACQASSRPKKFSSRTQQIRRAHDRYLGIAADDDGVGVVAGMAPAPGHRIAHDHEAGDLVDRVVHPRRLEGGAVAAFVPARVGGRTVEHAIDEEERHAPPAAPEPAPAGAATSSASQIAVSRMAGPSERCISSFICLRGMSVWYHSAGSQAASRRRRALSPTDCSRAPKVSRSWLSPWKSETVPRWALEIVH
jgi:hypothetical protein